MTKKDYVLVASVLKKEYARWLRGNTVGPDDVALALSKAFEKDNHRFDAAKFRKAVGITP